VAPPEKNEATRALFLHSTRSGETSQITFPPGTAPGDERFAISPDERQLAFRSVFNYSNSDIFLVGLPVPGPIQQVTHQQAAGDTLAWLKDSTGIISSTFRGSNYSLWLHSMKSSQEPSRLTEVGIEAPDIQSALQRNRLSWVNSLDDTTIWSVPGSDGGGLDVGAGWPTDRCLEHGNRLVCSVASYPGTVLARRVLDAYPQ